MKFCKEMNKFCLSEINKIKQLTLFVVVYFMQKLEFCINNREEHFLEYGIDLY